MVDTIKVVKTTNKLKYYSYIKTIFIKCARCE